VIGIGERTLTARQIIQSSFRVDPTFSNFGYGVICSDNYFMDLKI